MELKHCRGEFTNDAVHDLRVATRRILALLQLLHSISPHSRLQKLMRAFRKQLNEFDDLRDTQVILAEVSKVLQDLPQLQEFQKYLEETEHKMLFALSKKIKKFETSKIAKRMHKTYGWFASEVNEELKTETLQAVDDAYLLTKIRLGWVDLSRPATIHRVRIAFKSFRYMVEIIHPLLKEFPSENLRQMHEYQSRMGEIQDVEVFLKTFTDFCASASFSDVEPILRYCDLRYIDAISAYVENVNQLHTFWRTAEEQPFPWE
jgi:CHAD domain-containing protein